jgi:hypothetical protein
MSISPHAPFQSSGKSVIRPPCRLARSSAETRPATATTSDQPRQRRLISQRGLSTAAPAAKDDPTGSSRWWHPYWRHLFYLLSRLQRPVATTKLAPTIPGLREPRAIVRIRGQPAQTGIRLQDASVIFKLTDLDISGHEFDFRLQPQFSSSLWQSR